MKRECWGCNRIVEPIMDDGVTPFMLLCRATAGCPGAMHSRFYQDPRGTPTYEWYSPDAAERVTLDRETLTHVEQGGLLIRPIAAVWANQ